MSDPILVESLAHLPAISRYNHNYYHDGDGKLYFAHSDDDITTVWFRLNGSGIQFREIGYSLTSDDPEVIYPDDSGVIFKNCPRCGSKHT